MKQSKKTKSRIYVCHTFYHVYVAILKEMKLHASLPILTKPARAKSLPDAAQRVFELESRCTDLYDLCFPTVQAPGREWSTGPVMMK